ncbi:MAG TPA: GNAT family N-acetyltransferase [Actinomycetota bacterium]
MALSQAEPLSAAHALDDFVCGEPELELWLKRHALQNQAAGSSRTFVVRDEGQVVGYYALAAGSVEFSDAPERITKGLGLYPIPVVLLARLAVRTDHQGAGLGKALLKDAMIRTATTAQSVGVRALLVHAMHERAAQFYRRFGFEPSPTDPLHLLLLMKDLMAHLREAGYIQAP